MATIMAASNSAGCRFATPKAFTSSRISCPVARASVVSVRAAAAQRDGVESANQTSMISRRPLLGVVAAAAAAAALLAGSSPADAASRTSLFQQYYDKTDEIHSALHRVLDVDSTAADSTQALDNVNLFRDEANDWVGSYRGTMSVGRKSYAETYAAINTIQGHYTSRGADAPLPAKMRASAEKKLASAETFLKKEKARAEKPAPAGNPRK